MASEIEWLESALKDLDKEIEYVNNEFGYLVAQKVYQKIMDHIGLLASFPQMGMKYEDMTFKGYEVRKLPIQQLTVFYSQQDNKVTVLAVWNNYQDSDNIPSFLAGLE